MKNISYYFITVIIIFISIEITLSILMILFPQNPLSNIPQIIVDPILGYKPNPKYPGHDANGFRNKEIAKKVDIVCLGDSNTYGTLKGDSWPKDLAKLINLNVYNMSLGGYGPIHYLMLMNVAVNFKPKLIIEAFYSGNDLYDSFSMSYYLNNLVYPKTKDNNLVCLIDSSEKNQTLKDKIENIFNFRLKAESNQSKINHSITFSLRKVKNLIYNHVKSYRLLRKIWGLLHEKEENWQEIKKDALSYPADLLVFENNKFRTIFTPKYRYAALDLSDPRIYEGLNLTLKSMMLIRKRLDTLGIEFIVLLIPTKELVFSNIYHQENITNKLAKQKYEFMIENEKKAFEIIKNYLKANNILFIDALPCLQEELENDRQPYSESSDGHPNRIGYLAIAKCVSAKLQTKKIK